jgi:DNA-binding SARP family transcriptional activator
VRRVAPGVASLVALVGFLVGIPVALAVLVGRPAPTLDQLRLAVELRWFPASLAAHLGACVVWAGWAWGAASLAAQTWRQLRDRPARPWAGTGWMAPLIGRVVAMLMLIGVTAEMTPAWAIPGGTPAAAVTIPIHPAQTASNGHRAGDGRPTRPVVLTLAATAPTSTPCPAPPLNQASPAPPAAPAAPAATVVVHTVVHGDNLWDLAATYLGDPLRWRDIWTANRDRPMPGGANFADPSLILPGWPLTIPGAAASPPPASTPPAALAPVSSTPPAASRAAPAPPAPARSVAPTQSTSTTTMPAPAATTPPAPRPEAPPPPPATPPSPPPAHARPASTDGPDAPVTVGVPLGLGLAGAGVALVLTRMRRAQSRHRRPGRRVRLPDPDLAAIETALRTVGDDRDGEDTLGWVDRTMRWAAARIALLEDPPTLRGVLVTAGRADLIWDRPTPAPPEATADGDRWIIPRDAPSPAHGDGPSPAPALASVGATPDGAELLVNLEACNPLPFGGDPTRVAATIAAVAAGLAGAPWADGAEIVTYAGLGGLAGLDRVVAAGSDTVDVLDARATETADALHDAGLADLGRARLRAPGGPWAPTVVFSPIPLPTDLSDRLSRLAARHAGIIAVAPGLPDADRVDISADGTVSLLGHVVVAHHADQTLLEGIDRLVSTAADLTDVPADSPPYDKGDRVPAWARRPAPTVAEPDGPELWLLGPAVLAGIDGPQPRPMVLEALSFICCHPDGATSDQIHEALWPNKARTDKTLYNLIAEARRVVGANPDGTPRLSSAGNRWRALDTDIDRFAALAEAGNDDPALGLVRGRPFEGLENSGWVVRDGHAIEVRDLVVDVALRCAAAHLEAGELDAVEAAAVAGLRATRWEDRLYQLRMRAAAQAGDLGRVRDLYNELRAIIADDVAPHDDVLPDTTRLYHQLLSRPA